MEKTAQTKLFSEKPGVILDLGIIYTKLGFVGENCPRKIMFSPKSLFKPLKDISLDKNVSLSECFKNTEELEFELESFLHEVYFTELLVNPKERSLFFLENFLIPRDFVNSLAKIAFIKFGVPKIFFLFANSLPLYTTGVFSGITIEVGFYDTQVLPIFEGFPLTTAFAYSPAAGYSYF